MTPQYLLEIAGLPVTKEAIAKLTTSTTPRRSLEEARLGGVVVHSGGLLDDGSTSGFIRLIDIPAGTQEEDMFGMIEDQCPQFNSDNADYWETEGSPATRREYNGRPIQTMTFQEYISSVILPAAQELEDQESTIADLDSKLRTVPPTPKQTPEEERAEMLRSRHSVFTRDEWDDHIARMRKQGTLRGGGKGKYGYDDIDD
jgi:hypothetical protein